MARRTERAELLDQYRDSGRLAARAGLHAGYSTSPVAWADWLRQRLPFPHGARVLEVGCGAGWLWSKAPSLAADHGWQVTLTDLSGGMVAEARGALAGRPGFRFAVVDAHDLPFADGSFDGVLSCHMLYHVADRPRALAQFRRVLRPGGWLCAATNGAAHLREFWVDVRRALAADEAAFLAGPAGDLVGTVRNFGLENGAQQLQADFEGIELARFDDGLVVPVVEPLVDYARSTGRLTDDHLQELERVWRARLAADGPIRIAKESGLFTARARRR